MEDVEDIIEYIKGLKRGYDKEQFKENIDRLSQITDSIGLDYEEFHTLFKVWLNLCIPVNKWMTVGLCLVPREEINARTLNYALRWLLACHHDMDSFPRIAFLLDWLTAAMDCDAIDVKALNKGYEIFYILLSYELLTPHAIKLVYNLSKPKDVTRGRVLELISIAKKREEKKSKCRQIQVLLGLFKSYRPELVPESVPAFSIHTAFKKPHDQLFIRFSRCQQNVNNSRGDNQRLFWGNPFNMKGSKKVEPLVPNIEFINGLSQQYGDKETLKNYFDFTNASELVAYSLNNKLSRPAKLQALLCNDAGLMLLATADSDTQAFLSHELLHTLRNCFLQSSPHSNAEKAYFLRRVALLQRTLMQGIPVVTTFLAQYLPTWNEDFFHEILDLMEWLSVESPSHLPYILRPLARLYHRAQPIEQCAILKCCLNLYGNLAFAVTRERQHLMDMTPSPHFASLMSSMATYIGELCQKALQVTPDDIRLQYWSLCSMERMCVRAGPAPPAPPLLVLALPLLGISAVALDKLAHCCLKYIKLYTHLKETSKSSRKLEDNLWTLQAFTGDFVRTLLSNNNLTERSSGIVFTEMNPQLVERVKKTIPNAEAASNLGSNPALTCVLESRRDLRCTDNKIWFDSVIEPEYKYLSRFLKKYAPELRG